MLKRLRIQFIAIIMALLTLLLGSVIGLIYHFTRQSLVKESRDMMDSLAASPFQLARLDEASNRVNLPYCMLQVNKYGEILATNGGYYDLSDEDFLQELIAVTYSSTDMQGEIPQYHLRYSRYLLQNGQRLVFVDTTSEQATLHALLRSSLLLGAAALLLFFGVSLLLARRTVQPVEAAWQQQKQFVADASHELKTPLAAIRLLSDSILQTDNMDMATVRDFVTDIGSEAQRLSSITEDLLRLTRLDSGLVDKPKRVEVVPVLEQVMRMMSFLAQDKGTELTYQAEEGCVVMATRGEVHQVIYNLTDNAVKYSGSAGSIRVRLFREGGCVVLTVADNGPGIPEEDLPRVFERFYRVDKARSRAAGGTGLGLSIVQDTVHKRGGTVTATNAPGGGAVFTVRWPDGTVEAVTSGEVSVRGLYGYV